MLHDAIIVIVGFAGGFASACFAYYQVGWVRGHRAGAATVLGFLESAEPSGAIVGVIAPSAAVPAVCLWTEEGAATFLSGCGDRFQFDDGGPADNGCAFCPFCGGLLQVAAEGE